MLSVRNLNKVYRSKKGSDVVALHNINLDIADKGLIFLLGKSGSGKSTLLNILGGLDAASGGEIIIKGKSSAKFSKSDFDSYRNTFLGFVFQEFNILEDYSVGKNIGLALELQKKKADKDVVNNILDVVDLHGYFERNTNELSGGQKQRVSIARALVKNPDMILADEPTGSLDTATGKQVFDVLKRLAKDKLIIVVSHDRENAEVYADRIIELVDGRIIQDRTRSLGGQMQDTPPINFVGDNLVQLKAGYQLNADDVVKINQMLAKSNNNAYMSFDAKSNVEFESKVTKAGGNTVFEETGQENLQLKQYSPDDFKLVRSRFPLGDSLKMGASGLKRKPVRLFFIVILSLIAFTLFGFSITVSLVNQNTVFVNNFKQHGQRNLTINSAVAYKQTGPFASENVRDGNIDITDNQISRLEQIGGKKALRIVSDVNGFALNVRNLIPSIPSDMEMDLYYYNIYTHYFDFLEVPDMTSASLTLLRGRMPQGDQREIAINDYMAQIFLKYGIKDWQNDDKAVQINSYDDLIGIQIQSGLMRRGLTITGVVSTDIDIARLDGFKGKDTSSFENQIANGFFNTTLGYVYVGDKFSENFASNDVDQQLRFTRRFDRVVNGHLNLQGNQVELSLQGYANKDAIVFWQSPTVVPNSLQSELFPLTLNDDEVFLNRKNFEQFSNSQLEDIFSKQTVELEIDAAGIKKTYKVRGLLDSPRSLDTESYIVFNDVEALRWHVLGGFKTLRATKLVLPLSASDKVKQVLDYLGSTRVENGKEINLLRAKSEVTWILEFVGTLLDAVTNVFVWIGVAFCFFAAMLLMNFIGVSVYHKKKQIGILRAIGARSLDVFKIFFLEGLIIGLVVFALSSLATQIIAWLLNNLITINVLTPGLITFGLLLALSVAIVYIATWLPVHKIASKKPIDAINNR